MKQLHHPAGPDVPARGRWTGRRAVGALMALAAVALVAAILLGAPLVSIFIVGLLLLCPLLMWVPFRYEERALDQPGPSERNPDRD